MSSNYRMNWIWVSHGGQLQADIQRSTMQLAGMRNEMARSSRQMGIWQQQMRAVGTTIRYALAGGTVYAVAAAVGRLGEFQAKLGEIDSLAARLDRQGNLVGLGGQLDQLGDFALQTSNKFGIAVTDIEQHMARFYSSFDPPRGRAGMQQAMGFTNVMAQIALLAEGADPQTLAGGISGFIRGGGMQPVAGAKRMRDIVSEVMRLSPVITGTDIARDVGRLGSAQVAMRMSPEEIFAIYGAASLSGGSPAVIGRGITQLLTAETLKPETDEQLKAFRRLGLPTDPNALRRLGGFQVVKRMIHRLTRGRRLTEAQQVQLASGDLTDEEALRSIGLNNADISLGAQAFGRLESFRQILNLMAPKRWEGQLISGEEALDRFITAIRDSEKTERGRQRAELVNNQRFMQQAAESQRNLTLQVTRGFEQPFRAYSAAIQALSDAATDHATATTIVASGAVGGLIAGKTIGRFGRRFLGRGGTFARRMVPGAEKVADIAGIPIEAMMATEVMPHVISGAAGDMSRNRPSWVIIHPISWSLPGAPNMSGIAPGTGGGGGGGGIPPIVPLPGRGPKVPGTAGRLSRMVRGVRYVWDGVAWRIAPRAALYSGAAVAAGAGIVTAGVGAGLGLGVLGERERRIHGDDPLPNMELDWRSGLEYRRNMRRRYQAMEGMAFDPLSNTRYRMGAAAPVEVQGEAVVKLLVVPTPALNKLLGLKADETLGVPNVKLWSAQRPQSRGKSKTMRGGRTQ